MKILWHRMSFFKTVLFLFLNIWNLLEHFCFISACGHVKVVYDYKGNWVNCRIRLYPSIELQTVIVESHHYRWLLTRNISSSASPEVILQKNSGTYNKTKYNEDNFTLLIRNLTVLDVGRYEVECWSSNNVFYNSDKVQVKLPEWPTGSPGKYSNHLNLVVMVTYRMYMYII